MKNSKAGLIFIFITVTLDMIGIGLVIPSLPDIMRRFVSSETSVSSYFGYFISLYALMQFLASPLLGALSDRFGRRSVLLVSLLVAGFDYLLMAFAPNLWILFAGRILAGLTGANITVAMAYIADVSDDKNRAANFGMIGAAFGLGFIIGPAIGGLLGHYGPHYPFLMAAGMNLLNFLFGLFILPESLPQEKRRQVDISKINPLSSLKKVFDAKHILAFLIIYFLFSLAGQTHPSIWTLYTEKRFNWSTAEVGFSLAVVGLLSAVAQGWLTRVIIPWIGEYKSVAYGSLGYAVAFALFGLANEGWMMYVVLIFSSVFWVATPALQSLISHKTPPHEQGELQGTLVSLASLAAIITPIVTTKLFAMFTAQRTDVYLPGAPYFFAAIVSVVCWLILLRKKEA
ncbi:TCR/Tet family MFS transporter [Bdellovibrio reynosensis]|uniref:TCR/Tet family MFS transporter n=1 Tax=Bdellovibrio reynosensis TaxID=2835041 RepID=A0ABY4C4E0_9BACT|nr:TCR/Tet family MFS transporter [Bdellovibrio reynosensis]UOE99825.1 TCR/Tet family MFS transporter [Bdellovibrio reynosensis]